MSRPIICTLIVLLLLGSIFWPSAYNLIYHSKILMTLDRQAEAHVDTALKRALTTFALARATNAVISVLQGTEVQLAPAGLGLTLAPGEALDPVNDLIERFSWVMVISSTALGIQKFLILFGGWVSIKLVLAPALAGFVVAVWRRGPDRMFWGSLAARLLLLAMVLRLAAPCLSLANHGVYNLFLDQQFQTATHGLEQGQAALEEAQPDFGAATETAEDGLWKQLKRSGEQVAEAADFRAKLEWLEQKATEMIRHVLQLVVIFVLNTILLPVAFLWLIWRLLATLFRPGTTNGFHQLWQRKVTDDSV